MDPLPCLYTDNSRLNAFAGDGIGFTIIYIALIQVLKISQAMAVVFSVFAYFSPLILVNS
jgi:hypothetical protein